MLQNQLQGILDFGRFQLSDISPSEWAEKNIVIKVGNFPGKLSYDITPYSRKIIDCLSPYHPAEEVVIMASAKWGKTKTIIEPAIAYWIKEHPTEMAYLTGHTDLSEESMAKLDSALDNSGVYTSIGSQSLRTGNRRTGDTVKYKEFPGGSLISGSATNHKLLRQRDWRVVFPDDIEAAKYGSKESGDTVALIRERTKSFGNRKKICWVSTPETKGMSIIETLFLSGDQQHWHIPCEYCGEMITLEWDIIIEGTNEKAGIIYVEKNGRLVEGSVMYRCQKCGEVFSERNKREFNLAGMWIPSAEPEYPGITSFHLNSLYAPVGMDGWDVAVRNYLKANPAGGVVNRGLMKTFVNLTLGLTYEESADELKANKLQTNIRDYDIGIIPERLSLADGNGRIVLVTCGADLNGIVSDGRLDFEIVAHSENNTTYSILHGSIGTFEPAILKRKGSELKDREIFTYEEGKPNSIFPIFEELLGTMFEVDTAPGHKPRRMRVMITALDTGNTYKNHAYAFIDNTPLWVIGVKGKAQADYSYLIDSDKNIFSKGKERDKLFTLEVGFIKDDLAAYMQLNAIKDVPQPANFLNFPHPGKGLYEWNNFFSHFESERKILVANEKGTDVKARWEKKNSASQNHQWDCRVYNMAIKLIFLHLIYEMHKTVLNKIGIKQYDWAQHVKEVLASEPYL